jgi:uncharacterized sulfatase
MKTRRQFIKIAAIGAAAPLFGAQAGTGPNILWITCEDISANLGCYGDGYARTPILDALAKKGIRYTNAYGVTGVCAPNRSCLITGVYPSSLGSHDMRSNTRLPNFIKCFPEYLRKAGYYCTNNSKTDYNFPVPKTAWDECGRKAHWRRKKAGQPFFAVFNFTNTHESRCRGKPNDPKRFDPAKVKIPPIHPDAPEVRGNWAQYHENIANMDSMAGKILDQLREDGLEKDTIVFFFSDHGAGLPGCKKWIWHSGLHVPFIVHFPEKYATLAPGKPGSTCDRLVSFVDFAPTVLSLTRVKIPKHMQGIAFLGQQAGEARKYVFAHRDRMAERFDTVRSVRDKKYQYLRNFAPHRTWSQFVSYTEQMPTMKVWRNLAEQGKLSGPPARYFSPTKPVEELYDMETDPDQLKNLAADPKHVEVLERMRAQCEEMMKDTHDLGLLPEYELHRRADKSTPWEMGLDKKLNPVDRLLEAARKANAMDEKNIPALCEMLKSDEPAVRFWGAVGLVSLGKKAAPAKQALVAALEDDAPNVPIEAAEALCNLGELEKAMPVLLKGLEHPTPFIRLRAVNVLDRLGKKAESAVPAIRKAGMKSPKHPHAAAFLGRMVKYVGK